MSDDRRLWDRLNAAWDAYQHSRNAEPASRPTVDDGPDASSSADASTTAASDLPSVAPSDGRDETPLLKRERKWYEKKRYLVPLALLALFIYIGATGDDPADTQETAAEEPAQPQEPEPPEEEAEEPPPDPVVEEEPEPDPEPAAEEEVEPEPEPEPAPRPKFRRADYQDLTSREFAKIVRDPDSHIGEQVLVFGEVFQFDSLTGTDQFLANVDGDRDTEGEDLGIVSYDHNAVLGEGEFPRAKFDDVVEGDHFAAWVTVAGSFDYDTQIGGSTTATAFLVDRIKVLPPVE